MTHERPATIADIADVMRGANAHGKRVIPIGGGTHLAWSRPSNADVALHTSRLDRVEQYVPDDMTISIEAGMSARALGAVLAEHRCRLPLDVEEPDRATIGGMTAIGYSGPRRAGLGTMRDLLIGARAVLADGSAVKTGGMVVKNVSGYDMTKLLHGSLGSLGVIVQLNFKVLPMPAVQCAAAYELPTGAQAAGAGLELFATRLPYTAIHAASDGRLVVGCEGHPADAARLRAAARDVVSRLGGFEREMAEGASETARVWHEWINGPLRPDVATFRIATTPSRSIQVADEADAAGRAAGFVPSWRADVACGVVDVSVEAGDAAEPLAGFERLLIEAFGSVRVTRCPEQVRSSLAIFGREPRGLDLMRALKSQFDPKGVLNVGCNVGDI
jgi:glycolate oxidase FAD binding subunit